MKLLFFYVIFIGGIFNVAFAQSNLMAIGAKWFYSHPKTENLQGKVGYYEFEYIKDSVIQQYTTKTLSIKRVQSTSQIEYLNNLYLYYNGDSILFFNSRNNKFNVLYNFGANKGDTITVFDQPSLIPNFFQTTASYDSIKTFSYIIIDIDTIYINNKPFRRQFITNDQRSDWRICENTLSAKDTSEYIIESIGSNRYFFGYSPYITVETNQPSLRCYNDSNINYINPSSINKCDYFSLGVGIEESDIKMTSLFLTHNIAENNLEFHNINNTVEVSLFSLLGKSIYKQELSVFNNKINLDIMVKGLNLIQVKLSDGKIKTFKFIKL